MDNIQYASLSQEFKITQAIPESESGDTVAITVQRLSDSKFWNFSTEAFQVASASGAMTSVSGEWWEQAFTPDLAGTYLITINNSTKAVKYYQRIVVEGAVPSGTTGPSLTTLANVKAYLNISDTNSDTILQDLIYRVSKEIEVRCGRTFAAANYTEYHNGDDGQVIMTRQYPINSITAIYDDQDRVFASDDLVDADDYTFEQPNIIHLDVPIAAAKQNIKIQYNAGYATIPQDLEQAAIYKVAAEFKRSFTEINTPEGQTAAGAAMESLQKRADEIIERYRAISYA